MFKLYILIILIITVLFSCSNTQPYQKWGSTGAFTFFVVDLTLISNNYFQEFTVKGKWNTNYLSKFPYPWLDNQEIEFYLYLPSDKWSSNELFLTNKFSNENVYFNFIRTANTNNFENLIFLIKYKKNDLWYEFNHVYEDIVGSFGNSKSVFLLHFINTNQYYLERIADLFWFENSPLRGNNFYIYHITNRSSHEVITNFGTNFLN